MKSSISKEAHDASVIVVVLPRTIGIKKSQANDRISEALLEIHDLDFIDPFRNRIIVVLNDGMIQGYIFSKDVLMFIPVDLRRRRKNQFELFTLLNFKNVPRTDDIRRP